MTDIVKRKICIKAGDKVMTQYVNTAYTDIFAGAIFEVSEDTIVTSLDSTIPILINPEVNAIYNLKFRDIWKISRDGEILYDNNAWYQSWPPVTDKLDCEE